MLPRERRLPVLREGLQPPSQRGKLACVVENGYDRTHEHPTHLHFLLGFTLSIALSAVIRQFGIWKGRLLHPDKKAHIHSPGLVFLQGGGGVR